MYPLVHLLQYVSGHGTSGDARISVPDEAGTVRALVHILQDVYERVRDEDLAAVDGSAEEDCKYRLYIGKGRSGPRVSGGSHPFPHL